MRHALAATILTTCIPAWADQAVTFAARDDGFVVSPTASGTVRKDGPFLAVALTQHTMRQGRQFKTPTKVLEYRVGLARINAHGRWDVERWSAALPGGFTLSPGDTKQLPSITALIPIDNLQSLRDSWLVVQLKVQRDGTVGSTYAHSNKLVLD
ncbi:MULTISPECIES: hypothetical protein [unclassified Acidovorax]|uniref:hypothetical protein n=1 Tax=unclassified Acidovorax TaxID=2684926 RepID=UPI001C48306A|nr:MULTISPECIES: hypothetical protein [unclassified Acidovorax]MBV7428049.1 hypothetical protein [Acidovorax sp. sif0732]MBV7449306.1 hypothetical protein [Acidovorax sp. sif0715]